jgi:phosphoglycerate kinase
MLSRKIGLSNIVSMLGSKRVLLRADFNVPLSNSNIVDNTRIVETIPTIKRILDQRPSGLVLMSHLGRPDGKPQDKFSMRPLVKELEALLQRKVNFVDDCVSDQAVLMVIYISKLRIFNHFTLNIFNYVRLKDSKIKRFCYLRT